LYVDVGEAAAVEVGEESGLGEEMDEGREGCGCADGEEEVFVWRLCVHGAGWIVSSIAKGVTG
jgi:hypothetical protein